MKSDSQNNIPTQLTIFKPPPNFYKLSKNFSKNNKKQVYDILYNAEYSLRKYTQSLNMANNSDLLMYEWRKKTNTSLVNVLYIQLCKKINSSQQKENSFINVNIYTEHIEKTLTEIIDLNLTQSIYVLKECIFGFKQLFLKFAHVIINKSLIGLNSKGKLKIWVRENLSQNPSQNSTFVNDYCNEQMLDCEFDIVAKLIHMVSLLAASNCKFFFYGLQKELSLKKFTFNNCLQYINNYVVNTNNLEIPDNLQYMLQKKLVSNLQKSTVKNLIGNQSNVSTRNRKLSEMVGLTQINTITNLGQCIRTNTRQNTSNADENNRQYRNRTSNSTKRLSQNLDRGLMCALSARIHKQNLKDKENNSKGQFRPSIHLISSKSRKFSIKSNNVLTHKNSEKAIFKHRPSICVPPSFLMKNNEKQSNQSSNLTSKKSIKNTQKSFSLKSRKSSLLNSKAQSNINLSACRFGQQLQNQSQNKQNSSQKKFEIKGMFQSKKNERFTPKNINGFFSSTTRARSASANAKEQKKSENMLRSTHQQCIKQIPKSGVNINVHLSKQKSIDKVSTNSISNDTTKRRSFLTKTNYDSQTDESKNASTSRMNFSSMSIQNRIRTKKTDQDLIRISQNQIKRSLISYKYGFEGIIENPSCKQVEEQNQTRSYDGSSLKNTQNLADLVKIPVGDTLNNMTFGKTARKDKLKDSVQNLSIIRQKNEQLLSQNQWKKTINNLGQLPDMALNQSIVDCDQIIQKQPSHLQHVRLDKLQKLGRNMCFSIVKKSDDALLRPQSNLQQ